MRELFRGDNAKCQVEIKNSPKSFFLDMICLVTAGCLLVSAFGWKIGLGITLLAWFVKKPTE